MYSNYIHALTYEYSECHTHTLTFKHTKRIRSIGHSKNCLRIFYRYLCFVAKIHGFQAKFPTIWQNASSGLAKLSTTLLGR